MNRYSQDRITRLVKGGHITLLAEWVNLDGRLEGRRLQPNPNGSEGNWWTSTVQSGRPVAHPTKFRLGKHDRMVAAVEAWDGKRGSVVAFRINDPEDWRRIIREDAREELQYWYRWQP